MNDHVIKAEILKLFPVKRIRTSHKCHRIESLIVVPYSGALC
ncbi:18120_t:CDS:2 [Cetraspora pellucida]|uniref:18120_t:CDS:1 n=1 Tax=Cetraspora pellucida TaxID=1433469 RepID=A0ACA9KML3_9GLOM|nr:18120_t:CDS:2 [Cetraspora pellucida]